MFLQFAADSLARRLCNFLALMIPFRLKRMQPKEMSTVELLDRLPVEILDIARDVFVLEPSVHSWFAEQDSVLREIPYKLAKKKKRQPILIDRLSEIKTIIDRESIRFFRSNFSDHKGFMDSYDRIYESGALYQLYCMGMEIYDHEDKDVSEQKLKALFNGTVRILNDERPIDVLVEDPDHALAWMHSYISWS